MGLECCRSATLSIWNVLVLVMIHNHAHQKLFLFIIACPHSLLLPPSLLHDQYVIKLPTTGLSPNDWYIVKLPTSEPFSEPDIQHDMKLQARPDLA
jgi:hypothetical protein